jgi:long-chain acyl-CoA synthetase
MILHGPLPQTWMKLLAKRAQLTPHCVLHRFKPRTSDEGPVGLWKDVTAREFYERVRKVSLGLRARGVQAHSRVAIVCSTRWEWTLVDHAIAGLRAISVPVHPSLHPHDIRRALEGAQADFLIVESATLLRQIPPMERQFSGCLIDPPAEPVEGFSSLREITELGTQTLTQDPTSFERTCEEAMPEDWVTLLSTPGTTGKPKIAILENQHWIAALEDAVATFGPDVEPEGERLLTFLPLSHVLGKLESMSALAFGWTLCFSEGFAKIEKSLLEVQPTVLFTVPRLFERTFHRIAAETEKLPTWQRVFVERWSKDGPRKDARGWREKIEAQVAERAFFARVREGFGGALKFAICGGAHLPKATIEFFDAVGIPIYEGYGLTESTGPVTVNTPRAHASGTVGRPMGDVAIRIEADGEIWIRSRKVFSGYYNQPEETALALRDGWLRTGDVGELTADGFLRITDRRKELLTLTSGRHVAPQKIELLAKTHLPMVRHFAVLGEGRSYLAALLTLEKEPVLEYARENLVLFSSYPDLARNPKILAWIQRGVDRLNEELSRFEQVRKFVVLPTEFTVESGELSPSQQIRRKFLEDRYRTEITHLFAEYPKPHLDAARD